MNQPATLQDVSDEQERIGVLLQRVVSFCIPQNMIDLICEVEKFIHDREAILRAIISWTITYAPSDALLDDLMHPEWFDFVWLNDDHTQRRWRRISTNELL